MVPRIRDGVHADVDAVVTLVESAFRGDVSRAGWTTEADLLGGRRTGADEIEPAIASFLLAEDGIEVLGCCRLDAVAGGAQLGMLAVLPTRQDDGIGGALMRAAEERVRSRGGLFVELTVIRQRPELIAFYARHGYRPTGGTKPFPYGDERFGLPRRDDLVFDVLRKDLELPA